MSGVSEESLIPIGARVKVYSGDYTEYVGLGTYVGDVSVKTEIGSMDYIPKIELDNGKIILGSDCWFAELSDEENIGEAIQGISQVIDDYENNPFNLKNAAYLLLIIATGILLYGVFFSH